MPLAIVTGASAGFGRLFALQLARDGHDLLLVARREDRLHEVAELAKKTAIDAGKPEPRVELVPVDLLSDGAATKVFESAPDADLVINNAGYGHYGPAAEGDRAFQTRMVRLNCELLTDLTLLYARRMLERDVGTVLNIASTTAFQPVPYFAVYAATKAYVLSFSEAIDWELQDVRRQRRGRGRAARGQGPRVIAFCPGYSPTEFQAASSYPESLGVYPMKAEEVVRRALIAVQKGKQAVVPGLGNKLNVVTQRLVPRSFVRATAGRMIRPKLADEG